nr:MAG TPA_asm: hypothetical protein [Bacteriophage sp.]DAX95345.1 MAG TPA: hypothetical protein [Caudoviricetes sp.]
MGRTTLHSPLHRSDSPDSKVRCGRGTSSSAA